MRLVVLLAALLGSLVAGCTDAGDAPPVDQAGPDGDPAADAPAQNGEDRDDIVHSWQGTVTGAGVYAEPIGTNHAGSFSEPEGVRVPDNATSLTVEAELGDTTSTDTFLWVIAPDDTYTAGTLPDAEPGAPLRFEIADPRPGNWEATVYVEGVGVMQAYSITMTVVR